MNFLLRKINDFADFTRMVRKKTTWRYSNCYLLPETIQSYIARNQLGVLDDPNGFLIFCEERDFYYVYYYLEDPSWKNLESLKVKLTKPAVMDFFFRGGKPHEKITTIIKFWLINGFEEHEEYLHMKRKLSETERAKIAPSKFPPGYSWARAQPSQFERIDHLLRANLDIYSSPLPELPEMKELAPAGRLWSLLDPHNSLAGTLRTNVSGKLVTIRQLVIDPEYRSMGLADNIVKNVLASSQDCNHFDLWVKADNQAAIKLYTRNGYTFDGKRILQLIKI